MKSSMPPFLLALPILLLISVTGCGKTTVNLLGSEGIPPTQFYGIEPVYSDGSSAGNLTEAYIKNTEALVIVNGRLDTLCKANEIKDCGPR